MKKEKVDWGGFLGAHILNFSLFATIVLTLLGLQWGMLKDLNKLGFAFLVLLNTIGGMGIYITFFATKLEKVRMNLRW